MKLKHRETDYGLIHYKAYGYSDIIPREEIAKLSKTQVFQHIKPNNVKNNIKIARYRTGKYLYQLLWDIILENILEGNLISLPYGGKIYIGLVNKQHKKFANLHTYGKVFGLKIILNQPHSYHFKMNKKYRLQLMHNLKQGKNYHNY